MGSHIPLRQRKVIAAKSLFLRELEPLLDQLTIGGADASLKQVKNRLYERLNAILAKQSALAPDNVRLDDTLKALATSLPEGIDVAEGKPAALIALLLERFADAAARFRCDNCVGVGKDVCRGEETDDTLVAAHGMCLEELHNWFDAVQATVTTYYETFAGDVLAKCEQAQVRLSTAFTIGIPHQLNHDRWLGGEVRHRGGDPRETDVRVLFQPKHFDGSSRDALPYVLFHECVCHVPQGLCANSQGRVSPRDADMFAEGWMDFAARQVLEDCLHRTTGVASHFASMGLALSDQHKREGELFADARENHSDSESVASVVVAGARRYGGKAAAKLLQILQDITEDRPEALRRFFRLTFALNLSWDAQDPFFEHFVHLMANLRHAPYPDDDDAMDEQEAYGFVFRLAHAEQLSGEEFVDLREIVRNYVESS
jgi:hypothetical protein